MVERKKEASPAALKLAALKLLDLPCFRCWVKPI